MLSRLGKRIKTDEDIAKNAIFPLILAAVAPLDSKACISMNSLSFPEKFWQGLPLYETMLLELESRKSVVYRRRYGWSCHGGWNRCQKCSKLMPLMFELDAKSINQSIKGLTMCPSGYAPLWRRISRDWPINALAPKPKTKIEIDQTKKRQCASPRRQQLYNREAVCSPEDRLINQWLNKEDDLIDAFADHLLSFCSRRSTTASICCFVSFWYWKMRRNRVGDFWVFLVLKHA